MEQQLGFDDPVAALTAIAIAPGVAGVDGVAVVAAAVPDAVAANVRLPSVPTVTRKYEHKLDCIGVLFNIKLLE